MKVSREQAAANRERILDQAAKLFRERGFSGIGVADLMKSAGLTHGGFYGHFNSKEDLMAQACRRAMSPMLKKWRELAETDSANAASRVAARYLSTKHRDAPGAGCLIAMLGSDIARETAPVRDAVTKSVNEILDTLAELMPEKAAARREKAIAMFASMVGALIMARAVNDRKLSAEILQVVLETITPIANR
jgi:TetR/AcrR family transcriptional repressor of nem operon